MNKRQRVARAKKAIKARWAKTGRYDLLKELSKYTTKKELDWLMDKSTNYLRFLVDWNNRREYE